LNFRSRSLALIKVVAPGPPPFLGFGGGRESEKGRKYLPVLWVEASWRGRESEKGRKYLPVSRRGEPEMEIPKSMEKQVEESKKICML